MANILSTRDPKPLTAESLREGLEAMIKDYERNPAGRPTQIVVPGWVVLDAGDGDFEAGYDKLMALVRQIT